MKNRGKLIRLALCGCFYLFAVSAGSAQAAAPEFHAESAPVLFEGEQIVKHVFTVTGGTFTCKKTSLVGTNTVQTSTTLELTPVDSECTAFGRAMSMDTNDCKLMFHLVASSEPPTATVDITGCNEGTPGIVVTVPSLPCTVTIPPQNGLTHSTFKNEGTGTTRDILATQNISNLTYTEEGTGCLGLEVGKLHTGGTLTGTLTIKGFNDPKGAQQGIWVA